MYKLLVSFDVQDEKGRSLITEPIANTYSCDITKKDVSNLSLSSCERHLLTFLSHLHTSYFFQGNREDFDLGTADGVVDVKGCNYPTNYSLTAQRAYHRSHSQVIVKDTGDPYPWLTKGPILSVLPKPLNPDYFEDK